ncbi:3'-5' exonuclease [Catenuloplanes japonicus]|uniref:3'-5' exonuclease n=1 Tax=Catenuloplanes japonicus TaxID=33876 RepID=UPI000524C875|nr:3'-5' exonuclease [Catenuloplanes japonicus]
MNSTTWNQAPLVAFDLEGTGSQDKDREAILEVAAIRLADGRPEYTTAFHSLVNPGRPIPPRPWISPGLTDTTLATAPTTAEIGADLEPRLRSCYLVGHNIRVDWNLLRRHYPTITVTGLIDTLRLARATISGIRYSLTTLLDHFELTDEITAATGSRPHRALWDTAGTAVLLRTLVRHHWAREPTLTALLDIAGIPIDSNDAPATSSPDQETLFDIDTRHPS